MKGNNGNFKPAVKLFGRIVLASIMCFFVCLSMNMIGAGMLSRDVGYRILQVDKDGKLVMDEKTEQPLILEERMYEPGEAHIDEEKLPDDQKLQPIKEIPAGTAKGLDIFTQVLLVILLGIFPYSSMWELGDKDNTSVRYRGQKADSLRGLKIGLLASVPSFVMYILLVLGKCGLLFKDSIYAWFRFTNLQFWPFIGLVMGKKPVSATELPIVGILAMLLMLAIVPFCAWLGYYLGFKQISIQERLTYGKSKKGGKKHKEKDTEI